MEREHDYAPEADCRIAIEDHRDGSSGGLAVIATLIATNLARDWRCPVDADDLVQDAVLVVLRNARKYVPGKGAAFSYLTSIIKNSFRQSCRDARHEATVIRQLAQHRHTSSGGVGEVRRGVYDED